MKTLKLFLLFFMILYSPLLLFSQNTNPISKPHDFYPGKTVITNGSFATSNSYARLPSLYNNTDLSLDQAPQNEPSVKFSGKNPRYVVAAWRDFSQGVSPARRRIGYTNSDDSGKTFFPAQTLIPILDPNHPYMSDPVVCSDTNGYFYIATVSLTNTGGMDLVVYKSTNNGSAFTSYTMAAGGDINILEDKEWMVCDLTKGSSPYKNNLYITWTRFGSTQNIHLVKSSNGGASWTTPLEISNTGSVQGSCPAIGPNGEVYIVWLYVSSNTYSVYFSKSVNGGASFGTGQIIAQGVKPDLPITTGGLTFPSIAVDVSGGPRNGYIYVTFCDSRNGDPDVFLTRSTNGGTVWSTPVRVNNDNTGNGKLQSWPWIAVNETGKIVIIYYDSRNGTSNTNIGAWFARSSNGGQSFVNEAISSVMFNVTWPNSDVRFGDYIGVDYRGGRVVPVWTDLREGGTDMEIYTASIFVPIGIRNISTEIPEDFVLHQNYPNPFNAETKIRFEIPKDGFVNLKIFDITGREVETLLNEFTKAGVYETMFNASRLASGIYFYSLISGGKTDTRKMMYIK